MEELKEFWRTDFFEVNILDSGTFFLHCSANLSYVNVRIRFFMFQDLKSALCPLFLKKIHCTKYEVLRVSLASVYKPAVFSICLTEIKHIRKYSLIQYESDDKFSLMKMQVNNDQNTIKSFIQYIRKMFRKLTSFTP